MSSISSPVSSGDALAVEGLTGPAGAPVLFDIDLRVPRGKTTVIAGSLHAGKSMLVRHIVGLERAARGTVHVGGVSLDAVGSDPTERDAARARLGVVFEGSTLLRFATAAENVELPIVEHRHAPPAAVRDRADALLREAGFTGDQDREASELDRVDRRHVELARALALDPDVVILDEPTAGFDADAAHHFDEVLAQVQQRRNLAVVVLSRDARHVYRPAHEIVVLARGRVVARGTREQLGVEQDPAVRRFFHRRGGGTE